MNWEQPPGDPLADIAVAIESTHRHIANWKPLVWWLSQAQYENAKRLGLITEDHDDEDQTEA